MSEVCRNCEYLESLYNGRIFSCMINSQIIQFPDGNPKCVWYSSKIKGSKTSNLTLKKVEGDIVNANAVVVYGDVKGDVKNCNTVIVINGDVKGDVINCDTLAGLLADKRNKK